MENKELKLFSTRIEKDYITYLKIYAAKKESNLQAIVGEILTEWVKEKKKEGKI